MASRYGNIMDVETSGADLRTAKADGKNDEGVPASHRMAEHDLAAMNKYKGLIMKVAERNAVDPAVICGIISRESRAGTGLDKHGRGDNGKAFGLMQMRWGSVQYDGDCIVWIYWGGKTNKIDTTPAPSGGGHTPKGEWNSEEHLKQCTEILIGFIKIIQKKFHLWTKEQQLKGGIAAYNKGQDCVESYEKVDAHTTGMDYSNDVVARAQWFYRHGYAETRNYGIIVAAAATAIVGGVSAVVLAPIALVGIGFGAGGIAAGSTAASMMSAAAIANGGGVAAGSLVAVLQSAGAVGLSGMATAVVGSAGAAIGGALGGSVGWLKKKFS
ncbi:lysozyme g isoform X1 [Salmo salar]|uniref:Lysozyme g isoform X1 n=2 Tax=Salmo salar TaxID=8030 RepID=A0ABM3F7H4_SALSA|nr:lysozyme g isoform X1 [Salmo salar]